MADMKNDFCNFAKNVWKKAEAVTETVTQKTEETIEVQKIKGQIRGLERQTERDYQAMGKLIYERYRTGETMEEPFAELCREIKEREEEILKCKKEIASWRGQDVCPKCKRHVDDDATYCPNCGEKISRSIFEDEE